MDAETLLTSYERGTLTRRQLLAALAMIGASSRMGAQQPTEGIVRPTTLDHVNIQVADPVRTEAFYRKLFGFPPSRPIPSTGRVNGFDLQGAYFTFQKSETPGRIDHFCVAVEGTYDVKQIGEQLKAPTTGAGMTGIIVDPDGIKVQLWPVGDRQSHLPFPSARAD